MHDEVISSNIFALQGFQFSANFHLANIGGHFKFLKSYQDILANYYNSSFIQKSISFSNFQKKVNNFHFALILVWLWEWILKNVFFVVAP